MSDLSWFRNRFPYTKLNDINLDWLLKRMKELSALVVSYADDIQRALTQSSTAITQSETAVNSANNALSIANSASATADAVSGIAEDARTIASAANNTAIHAVTVANGIAETAQSALDTAQDAETIANDAAQAAGNAQTTAQNAVTIANGANTRAGNAEQSALTAISTASAAQQTATDAAQNAQTAAQNAQTAAQNAQTAAQNAQTAAEDAQTAQQAATTIAINKADIITDTIAANVVNFPDGANGLPLKSLEVNIETVQAGSGDPSPTNIRPFSGWSACNISHSGEDTTNPTVNTVDWETIAGTIYGGSMVAINRALTVIDKRRHVTVDGNKIQRTGTTASGYNFIELKSAYFAGVQDIVMTDCYPVIKSQTALGIRFVAPDRVFVYDDRFVDLQTAKDLLDATNIEVLCERTTPVVYQLAPQELEILTLYGTNNIWADCGPVSVEYRADTKLYIEKINAPSDNDMIANEQITSGKYFIICGKLYKSTTVIAQDDAIIPGSNCIETNLADALNSLI